MIAITQEFDLKLLQKQLTDASIQSNIENQMYMNQNISNYLVENMSKASNERIQHIKAMIMLRDKKIIEYFDILSQFEKVQLECIDLEAKVSRMSII